MLVSPPPKAALSHVLPRDLCMSEISILWFNVRETVVMKVLLWLMAGSAVFFQGTLWIVFKCIYIKCSDVVGRKACGEEAEHGDGGRSKTDFFLFFSPTRMTLGFAKPAINYGHTNTQTQTQWWWRLRHICIPSTKFVKVASSNSGTCNVCAAHIFEFACSSTHGSKCNVWF